MKNFKKFIAVLLCLSVVMLCGCNTKDAGDGAEKKKLAYGAEFPYALEEDVTIEDCYLYSGEYPEDGSFEPCENVLALKVKNNSAKDIQLLRIKVTTDSKVMEFEVTTLLAGATVIVLEKTKQTMAENEKIQSLECTNRADFGANVSLKEDIFLVHGNPKSINIKNISETEIKSEIYVYYKRTDADGNYFGGITFRTKAEGLLPGAIKQLPAAQFEPDNSEVLFVDYAS